jgi:alanine dehydrogenase
VAAGAQVLPDAPAVFAWAEMIVKVKEPQPQECAMLRPGQMLFTYLHLAPDPVQAEGLLASGCTAIAYETITDARGGLPLLAPMSEVAGRMAVQVGAVALQKAQRRPGVLLGGVPGVPPAQGLRDRRRRGRHHAARMAVGLGAEVTVLDARLPRLRQLDEVFGGRLHTVLATWMRPRRRCSRPIWWSARCWCRAPAAPKLIRASSWSRMKPGSGHRRRGHRPGRLLRDLAAPPRTPIRPMWSTAWSTTAWPTCRARCRAPRPSR